MVTAAISQTGQAGVAAAVDTGAGQSAGTRVQFITRGADATRTAWALAHWAVAQADTLTVVGVSVDGKQWRRQDVDARLATHDLGRRRDRRRQRHRGREVAGGTS